MTCLKTIESIEVLALLTAEDRIAFLSGFKMALESRRTSESKKIDYSAIVVRGKIKTIDAAMEYVDNMSDKEIEKIIKNSPKELF